MLTSDEWAKSFNKTQKEKETEKRELPVDNIVSSLDKLDDILVEIKNRFDVIIFIGGIATGYMIADFFFK